MDFKIDALIRNLPKYEKVGAYEEIRRMKNVIIMLNGAKKSGKDTLSDHFSKHSYIGKSGLSTASFRHSQVVVQTTILIFGIDREKFLDLYSNRETKEKKSRLLSRVIDGEIVQYSPREALIFSSEQVLKPVCGEDFPGVWFSKQVNLQKEINPLIKGFIVPGAGFKDEVLAAKEINDGNNSIYLLRINDDNISVNNDGVFEGDSRKLLNPSECNLPPSNFICIDNTNKCPEALESFLKRGVSCIESIYEKELPELTDIIKMGNGIHPSFEYNSVENSFSEKYPTWSKILERTYNDFKRKPAAPEISLSVNPREPKPQPVNAFQ